MRVIPIVDGFMFPIVGEFDRREDAIRCRNSSALSMSYDPEIRKQLQQQQDDLRLVDRNVLGVMQLVAKLLEIWFVFIAGTLVYSLLTRISARDGVPFSMLLLYDKVTVPTEFLSKSLWSSPTINATLTRPGLALPYSFLVLVALLCIATNLMGSATAILLLPAFGRAEIGQLEPIRFVRFNSDQPAPEGRGQGSEGSPAGVRSQLEVIMANVIARGLNSMYSLPPPRPFAVGVSVNHDK